MRFSVGVTSVRRYGPVLLLAGLAVGALAVFEPSVLTSTARSPRAIGTFVGLAVGTSIVGRLAARRWGRGAGRLTGLVAVGLAVWLLVLPALRQTTLDEAFPVAVASATSGATPETTSTVAPTTTTTTAPIETPTPLPAASIGTPTPPPTPTSAPTTTTTTASPAPKAQEPAAVATDEPVRLTTGRLEGIDHQATGTVSVFRLADGSAVVRFDEVDIRGAPDPVLYLVPGADRRTRDGGLRVANLKGTKGSFNHPVPASFDLDQPFTVFIWCDRFAVPIANADQRRV